MTLPWMAIITIPAGGIALVVFVVISIVDSIALTNQKTDETKAKLKHGLTKPLEN